VTDLNLQMKLANVPGITSKIQQNEIYYSYYSLKTNHLFKMNKASRQRRPRTTDKFLKFSKKTAPVSNPPAETNKVFFKNNRGYVNKRNRNQRWRPTATPQVSLI
jgi:hypothetical protein